MTTCTLKIGATEIPVDGVTWERSDDRVDATPPALVTREIPIEPITLSVDLTLADVDGLRAFYAALPEPRHTLTFTRRTRSGETITETIEGITDIRVVIARRGLKRPGQWTDATRAKRARRLARAAERRAGISRRGLRRGFPMRSFALGPIHAEYKARITREQASAVEHAVNEDLRARFGEQAPTLRYEVLEAVERCPCGDPRCPVRYPPLPEKCAPGTLGAIVQQARDQHVALVQSRTSAPSLDDPYPWEKP